MVSWVAAYVPQKDDMCKLRTFVRGKRRKTAKKDAVKLDCSGQGFNFIPDETACPKCVLGNRQLNSNDGKTLTSSRPFSANPSHSSAVISADAMEIKVINIPYHNFPTQNGGNKEKRELSYISSHLEIKHLVDISIHQTSAVPFTNLKECLAYPSYSA